MDPLDPSDPHAPYVRELAETGDWAGLARYWMAHRLHRPALDRAIELVRDRARTSGDPWPALARLLEEVRRDPASPERRPPEVLFDGLSNDERLTLELLLLFPVIALCELGTEYPAESRAEALEMGILAVDQASAIADRLGDGASLANLAGVKALAEQELNDPDAARADLQQSLAGYRELAKQRPDVYRPQVAEILNNLGYIQRALDDPEGARASFQEALAIRRELARRRPHAFLADLAMTLNDLGNAQRALNDLEGARASYQEAMETCRDLARHRPDIYQRRVAGILNNLGNIQRALNDLEEARVSYQEALAIFRELARQRPDVFLADLALTLSNLATAQSDLKDLEGARAHFQEALAGYRELARHRPEVFRRHVAWVLDNLGNLQRDLKDLEGARASLGEALEILRELARREVFRPDLTLTLNNLGTVEQLLNDLEGARAHFQEALAGYRELARHRPEVFRRHVAGALNNVGNIQHALDDLEGARASQQEALAILRELSRWRPDAHRADLALTLNNLGAVQRDLDDPEGARASFQEAAELYEQEAGRQPTARLMERQGCWANLGRLMLRERPESGWPDLRAARAAFQKSVACAELFRERFRDERQRRRVQQESLEVYERLIEICVDLAEIEQEPMALAEAVETAEKSRARRLMELLARETLRPANTPPDLEAEFQALLDHLQRAVLRLQQEADRPAIGQGHGPSEAIPSAGRGSDLASLQADVDRIEGAYQDTLRRVRGHDPEFDPDKPVVPIDAETARGLLPRDVPTAIVEYTLTARRGLALVITDNGIEHVPLPELDAGQAFGSVEEWYRGYYETCRIAGRLDGRAWSAWMAPILDTISGRAIRPVVERLNGIGRLILVPNRALHAFPLHACPLDDGGLVDDAFEVVYAPSLSILHRCVERPRPRPERLLIVENPTGDLAFTEMESGAIRPHFAEHVRKRLGEARREWLLDESGRFQVWHYAGHSQFEPTDPLASGLVLEHAGRPDRWLTLRDIFTRLRLPEATLAVLSGCESGSILPDLTDEYVGLPSGFLFAGATCVVASLWSVPDLATAVLMGRFYANWREGGMHIGAALRAAQRWLREGIASGEQLREEVATEAFLDRVTDRGGRERCRSQRDFLVKGSPEAPPFAGLADWAAFTAIGLAYPRPERAAPDWRSL